MLPAVKQQKARKLYKCGKCGGEIKVGEDYYRIAQKWQPVRIRCVKCRPRPSELTTSDKLSRLYGAQENLQDILAKQTLSSEWLSELAEAVEDAMNTVEEVRDEYEESASNMEEYFPDSERVEEIREKSENCDEWYNELSNTQSDIEDLQTRVSEWEAKEEPPDEPAGSAEEVEVWRKEHGQAREEWENEKAELQEDLDNVVNDVESASDSLNI